MSDIEIFESLRPLLFSIAYRMLGSVMDAEDIVQEAYLQWQRRGDAEIASPRAFLSTIVTRQAINHLNTARVRRKTYPGPWLPEPVLNEVEPDTSDRLLLHESLSMAFIMLLEQLTPVERAVFLLHDVFIYDFSDRAYRWSFRGKLPADRPASAATHPGAPPTLRRGSTTAATANAAIHNGLHDGRYEPTRRSIGRRRDVLGRWWR
jgi:RNA polymerase sigma factor (sigma-70 family)